MLERYRTHYLTYFKEERARAQKQHGGAGGSELLFAADTYVPEELYKLLRGDYAWQTGERWHLVEFHQDALPDLPTEEFEMGECKLLVRPFYWNRCTVNVHCDRFDREALVAWATHWIDIDDERPRDADGFKQAIHNVTPPSYPLGKFALIVDLGTAPVRALSELLRLFAMEQGTTLIVL